MAFAHARLIRLALVIFIVGLSAVAVRLPSSVKADSSGSNSNSSVLDGSGTYVLCTNQIGDTHCEAQSLTTSQPDDLIMALADCTNCAEPGMTPPTLSSVADQTGMNFTQRYSFATNSSLWEAYAFAPSPLTNDNITALFADPSNGAIHFQVLAFQGVDFSTIFDPDPSLPSTTPCQFTSQPASCSTSFSTSGKDLVVASTSINDMPGCQNETGYTNAAMDGWWEVDYGVFDSALNNYTFTCGSSSSEYTEPVAIAVDAIMLTTNPSPTYTVSWQGYDWDGGNEETLTLNGQFMASLPAADNPQNAGNWASFSVNTKMFTPGSNTLTFSHANWDCGVTDNVENLVVSNGTMEIYANPTSRPMGCGQPLTYTINTLNVGSVTLSNDPSSADWGSRRQTWTVQNGYMDGLGLSAEIQSRYIFPSDRNVTVRAITTVPGDQSWYTAWVRGKYSDDCNSATLILLNGDNLSLDLSVASGCVAHHYMADTGLQSVTTWHTITMQFIGNEVRVYVDGNLYIDATDAWIGSLGADHVALASWGPSESQFDAMTIS